MYLFILLTSVIVLTSIIFLLKRSSKRVKTNIKTLKPKSINEPIITQKKEVNILLEDYFSCIQRYFTASFLRKNALNFKSISLSDIESLEKKYPEVSVNTITFPFKGSELINNMEDVNKFILNEIMKLGGNIDFDKKNDHSVILKELKKLLAIKTHMEILKEIKNYIKDENEIEKWNLTFDSPPVSILI